MGGGWIKEPFTRVFNFLLWEEVVFVYTFSKYADIYFRSLLNFNCNGK